jgi:hypothetical protein
MVVLRHGSLTLIYLHNKILQMVPV